MNSVAFGDNAANRFVDFEQKKSKVRGILKKRAKRYECKFFNQIIFNEF